MFSESMMAARTKIEIPSFLYAALDQDTQQLANELEQLGGGDAKAVPMEVHGLIGYRQQMATGCTINFLNTSHFPEKQWNSGNQNKAVVSLNFEESGSWVSRRYTIDSCSLLTDVQKPSSSTMKFVSDLSKWVFDGFNAFLLAYGERHSGKTTTLFGKSDYNQNDKDSKILNSTDGVGIASDFLRSLYDLIHHGNSDIHSTATVALSAWVLEDNQLIDLFRPSSSRSEGTVSEKTEFCVVQCPSLKDALSLLTLARSRAVSNNCVGSHFFLRIMLHMALPSSSSSSLGLNDQNCSYGPSTDVNKLGTLSHFHLVDLVGSSMWSNLDEAVKGHSHSARYPFAAEVL